MKLFTGTSAILLSTALFFGCTKTSKTLVMAEVNPPDSVAGQMDNFFANEVKRLTKGEILIELNSSGIFGDEHSVIQEMSTKKKIDIARISLLTLNSEGVEKSAILTIPYIFNDRKHFWKFAKSDLASEILDETISNPNGFKGLFLAEEGFRHFFSNKPLNTIDDLSSLYIRSNSDPILDAIITDLGSQPVHVPFHDIIKEMAMGTIDGAEQPLVNYKSNLFDTVAPNMILDGHTIGVIEVLITNQAWNELTHTQQEALLKAGENAAEFSREICEEREKLVIESLKATGANIVEVKDKTPWQKACKKTIQKYAQKDMDLFNKIVEMGKQEK